jgi:hypothetical protein
MSSKSGYLLHPAASLVISGFDDSIAKRLFLFFGGILNVDTYQ